MADYGTADPPYYLWVYSSEGAGALPWKNNIPFLGNGIEPIANGTKYRYDNEVSFYLRITVDQGFVLKSIILGDNSEVDLNSLTLLPPNLTPDGTTAYVGVNIYLGSTNGGTTVHIYAEDENADKANITLDGNVVVTGNIIYNGRLINS